MELLYLEGAGVSRVMVEALPPHTRAFAYAAYALSGNSDIVPIGCTQVTHTSELGHETRAWSRVPLQGHRRHLCRTASRAFWPSVWLPSSQLALSRPKKNSSWSSPSRPSLHTQASTSKPFQDLPGQAFGPASNFGVLRSAYRLTRTRRPALPQSQTVYAAPWCALHLRAVALTSSGLAGQTRAAMGSIPQMESAPC